MSPGVTGAARLRDLLTLDAAAAPRRLSDMLLERELLGMPIHRPGPTDGEGQRSLGLVLLLLVVVFVAHEQFASREPSPIPAANK
jgi:hypothetical protein